MLKGVIRGKRKPPRVVLYGPPGIGKSTFGSDAPKPIFITTEDGIDNLPVDQFEKALLWERLIENVKKVAREDHEYETIVIDTLNGCVELCANHVCETMYGGMRVAKKGDAGYLAWGQGPKATSEVFRELLAELDWCRDKGMGVVFLAHAGLMSVRHPVEGEYNKFAPEIEKPTWARVSGWADIILRCDFEYVIMHDTPGPKGRAVGTQTRKVYCNGSAAEDAKCRVGYELPDEFSLSWDDFAAHLGSGSATLEEVKGLWGLLTKEQEQKTLLWLGVDRIEDADLTKMRQLLNRLRQVQAEKNIAEKQQTTEEAA